MRGRQSLRKGVWYLAGRRRGLRKREQKGGAFPVGLLGFIAAPFIGEIPKPILKDLFVEEGEGDETKHTAKTTYDTTKNSLPKRTIVPSEVRESKQTKFTAKHYNKTEKTNWTAINAQERLKKVEVCSENYLS